jgi:hypothetical protein
MLRTEQAQTDPAHTLSTPFQDPSTSLGFG